MTSTLENHIELVSDPIKRFIARAKNDIPKGTIITITESIAISLLPEFRVKRCENCLELENKKLLRCSKCKSVGYCSKECQKQDWNIHKMFCCLKSIDDSLVKSIDFQILVQILLFITKFPNSENTKSWNRLMLAKGNILLSESYQKQFHIIASSVLFYFPELAKIATFGMEKKKLDMDDNNKILSYLVSTLGRYHGNSFIMHDSNLFPFGEGVFPETSLHFNSSCYPNSVIDYIGRKQNVRTIRNIEKGEEITIAYVDGAVQRSRRRSVLLGKYGFECHCERCSIEGPLKQLDIVMDINTKKSKVEIIEKHFKVELQSKIKSKIGEKWDIDGFSNIILDNLISYDDKIHLNEMNIILPKLFNYSSLLTSNALNAASNLFYDYLENKDWEISTRLAKFIFAFYKLIYPPYYPITGQHAYNLAKSVWNNESKLGEEIAARQALTFAIQSRNILIVTQGEIAYLLDEVIAFIDLISGELKRLEEIKDEKGGNETNI